MELKYFDIGIHFEFMLTFYILAVRCGGRWLYILTFYWAITNRNEARYLEILSPDHAWGCDIQPGNWSPFRGRYIDKTDIMDEKNKCHTDHQF